MITSSGNAKIKLVRSLMGRSRHRKTERAFIAEGVRLLEEALAVDWPVEFILFDQSLSERGLNLLQNFEEDANMEVSEISAALMAEISDTETPQGILAVLQRKKFPLTQSPSFIIIADQIRDPGNMGTLLRTAEAAGAEGVLLAPGTVDAFSPKVIRAGMGAHFRLPIHPLTWEAIKAYLDGLPIFLATSGEGLTLWEANFKQPCAIMIGGEAFGASTAGEALANQRVSIPMPGRAESLNAAIAAGILIAEVLRQRYKK